MTAPIRTFLETQLAKINALVNGSGDKHFPRQWISPGVDVRRMLRVPRFPTVLINDEGGGPLAPNHLIEARIYSATVCLMVPADHVGDRAERELLDLIEILLWGDGTHPGIGRDTTNAPVQYWEAGVSSVVTDEGVMIVSKTLTLPYELARAPEAEAP